jgi:hypothetical protein
VEFAQGKDGDLTLFYVGTPQDIGRAKTRIASLGQEVLDEVSLGARQVLVTRGDKSEADIRMELEQQGDNLVKPVREKKFQPWKWRGRFSDLGQGLSLAGSVTSPGGVNVPDLMFSVLNLTANWVNKTRKAKTCTSSITSRKISISR